MTIGLADIAAILVEAVFGGFAATTFMSDDARCRHGTELNEIMFGSEANKEVDKPLVASSLTGDLRRHFQKFPETQTRVELLHLNTIGAEKKAEENTTEEITAALFDHFKDLWLQPATTTATDQTEVSGHEADDFLSIKTSLAVKVGSTEHSTPFAHVAAAQAQQRDELAGRAMVASLTQRHLGTDDAAANSSHHGAGADAVRCHTKIAVNPARAGADCQATSANLSGQAGNIGINETYKRVRGITTAFGDRPTTRRAKAQQPVSALGLRKTSDSKLSSAAHRRACIASSSLTPEQLVEEIFERALRSNKELQTQFLAGCKPEEQRLLKLEFAKAMSSGPANLVEKIVSQHPQLKWEVLHPARTEKLIKELIKPCYRWLFDVAKAHQRSRHGVQEVFGSAAGHAVANQSEQHRGDATLLKTRSKVDEAPPQEKAFLDTAAGAAETTAGAHQPTALRQLPLSSAAQVAMLSTALSSTQDSGGAARFRSHAGLKLC